MKFAVAAAAASLALLASATAGPAAARPATAPSKPAVVLDKKIAGVRYMDHVVFSDSAAALGRRDGDAAAAVRLNRRGGGGGENYHLHLHQHFYCSHHAAHDGHHHYHYEADDDDDRDDVDFDREAHTEARVYLLKYYGGPVISNVEVTILLWGAANYASDLEGFYSGVTNSTYFDMLAQYYTPTQTIGRGTFVKSISLTGLPSSKSIDDSAIQTYLRSLVSAGTITPSGNTYYPIHFAPGYSITQGGQGSCQVFCAYHGTIDVSDISSTKYLYYGVLPDQGGSCAGGCGSAATTFQNLCSVSSHELVEATTDAAVGVASVVGSPLAWYNTNQGEIGDICNAQQGTVVGGNGVTYTVQKEYSNNAGACVLA
ncbi:hypothetical protein DFJ73DRAFT_909669 [Zopfochytrium polystomum]|nr:hypothetical protein DFJ73DRAFT_909669 [Zopfochytrium polystomum]